MTLTDFQKKKISDRALGEAISQNMNIHDQVAAIRKQVIVLSTAAKVSLVPELFDLETVVSREKAKMPTKFKTKSPNDDDDRKYGTPDMVCYAGRTNNPPPSTLSFKSNMRSSSE